MTKDRILSEIKRTADANGGAPLGWRTFTRETGIVHADWFGIHWRSWGDAVREAGLQANALTGRIDDDLLLERYAQLTRALGRRPVKGDLRMKRHSDSTFPSDDSFARRFGSYPALRSRAQAWCAERAGYADVVPLLEGAMRASKPPVDEATDGSNGYVYMIKHGARSEYKIGRTLNPVRREGELRLELPEKLSPVHYIETDDPAGVERYWHSRFASKRKQGEWFLLAPSDVRAFKKWKRIS